MNEKYEEIFEEESRHDKLLSFCSKYKGVWLYGNNKVGNAISKFLTCKGYCVKGFLDNCGSENNKLYTPPVSEYLETNVDISSDGIVICIIRDESTEAEIACIRDELVKKGLESNIYVQDIYKIIPAIKNTIREDGSDISQSYFKDDTELDNIGLETGTDKSSRHHDFLRKYEHFLFKFKNAEFTLLELGVFKGESLDMWSRYFPNAEIIGADYDKNCLKYNEGRKKVVITDLSKTEDVAELCRFRPSIIIDDASHIWSHQIKALFTLYNVLPHGGIYILEDIETSFWSESGYKDASISPYDICAQIAEAVTSGTAPRSTNILSEKIISIASETELTAFICGSCILIKK